MLLAVGWLLCQPASLDAQEITAANTSRSIGEGRWDWTVFIQAPPSVLERIKCVEYTLHPTFPNPVRRVCARGKNNQAFALSTNGWGTFTIGIDVLFTDGRTQHLEHQLQFASGVPSFPPSCKTQISLSLDEGSVRRLRGDLSNLAVYAEEIHDSDASLYVVNSTKPVVRDGDRVSEKELVPRLRKAGLAPASGPRLTPDTYWKTSLAERKPVTLDLPSGKVNLTISSATRHKRVDLDLCLP
jgi:hypothetical protein